jgi:tryptophanyl-tRNA synthetase
LIEIHATVTGATIAEVEREFGSGGYGAFKSAVADAVVEYLRPARERYEVLAADPREVDRLLAIGADTATGMATEVLERAKRSAGLLPRAARG